jgi:photosystem II stability/assembly factor-like uncharacterized protein
MRALVALLTVVCLTLVTGSFATHSPWPDAKHGWEIRCDRDGICSLYATEDGGRHWHRIFNGETDDVMGFLRTSATGGVISINVKAPEQYWTRDNGRHWYFTRRLPPSRKGASASRDGATCSFGVARARLIASRTGCLRAEQRFVYGASQL